MDGGGDHGWGDSGGGVIVEVGIMGGVIVEVGIMVRVNMYIRNNYI